MNSIEQSNKVLLAQHVDVVTYDQFQASETTSHDLFLFIFDLNAYSHSYNSPSFILNLLATSLNYFLDDFQD